MLLKEKIPEEFENKILMALYKYYLHDITFERAAEDASIPIYFLVQYVNDNDLPIVHTEKDITDGIHKTLDLMKKAGMDISKLEV